MAKRRAKKRKVAKRASRTLAQRVAELEDREAIRSLVNGMNWTADESRLDDLFDCFTDDVVFDVGAFGTYRGKPALRGFYEQTINSFPLRIHYVMNQVIGLRSVKAKSRGYWKAELDLLGRAVTSSGHYFDELVKQRGQWKLAKRTVTITYMCPLDEGWSKTRMMTMG
jgi:hypothetical protein